MTYGSMTTILLSVAAGLLAAQVATAQVEFGTDLKSSCKQIQQAIDAGDTNRALEQARLCVTALEEDAESALESLFPKQVAGYERTDFRQERAMGFANTSASYRGEDATIRVELTGGAGSGGLAGLGNLARMQMAAGGGGAMRVDGLDAMMDERGAVTIFLADGAMLKVSSREMRSREAATAGLPAFLNEFPVKEISDARSE
ncbi:MAG: hypothetical protein AAFX85_02315 [Pseudomonadota bacterium]